MRSESKKDDDWRKSVDIFTSDIVNKQPFFLILFNGLWIIIISFLLFGLIVDFSFHIFVQIDNFLLLLLVAAFM